MIFRGTFEHALDAKHRLTVPAKYRAALAGGVVLALTPEIEAGSTRSLAIWPAEAFEEYAAQAMADANPLSPRARKMQRTIHNNAFDLELDSANRLMIPARAMVFAGLEKDVVVAGSGPCLEVWDRTAYYDYNDAALAEFPEITASLDNTD